MKLWKIPVSYIVAGTVLVEAETLENAIDKVWDDPCLPVVDEEYVDGSWQIDDVEDVDLIRRWYNDGQSDESK